MFTVIHLLSAGSPVVRRIRPPKNVVGRFPTRLLALLAVLFGGLVGVFGSMAPAMAETPSAVAAETVDDGVYVAAARRASVQESELIAVVDQARIEGYNMVVALPDEPQPSARAFARRVQEQTEADVALVFPEDGPLETYAMAELVGSETRAREVARDIADPVAAVAAFKDALTTEPERSTPPIVGQVLTALLLFVLIVAAVAFVESRLKRGPLPAPAGGQTRSVS